MSDFEPVEILRVLLAHDVEFIVIGGIAGNLLGSTSVTRDLDVLYDRDADNIGRLADALADLRARLRGVDEALPFRIDAHALRNGSNFTFTTRLGDLDCLGETSGRFTYATLAATAETMEVEDIRLRVVSLDDLIRMKRAAGRNKDLIEVENLTALRDVRDGRAP
ncbi:MAG: hypothetical protein AAB295_11010 [Chloroflexota bacterium]